MPAVTRESMGLTCPISCWYNFALDVKRTTPSIHEIWRDFKLNGRDPEAPPQRGSKQERLAEKKIEVSHFSEKCSFK